MKLLGAEVRAGEVRLGDPEGRHERGAARLGHQCRRHLLPDRHGRRPASLSGDGARLPVGDRRRDARADARRPKAACPTRWSPASAAAPTPWACSIPSSTIPRVADVSASRRRATASRPARTPPRSPAAGPACCTATAPICCRTTTARSSTPIRSRPASTIPASARSMPGCTIIGRVEVRLGHRRGGAGRLPAAARRLEGIIPALEPAHALADVAKLAPTLPQGPSDRGQPLRPRRQGHLHRRRSIWARKL